MEHFRLFGAAEKDILMIVRVEFTNVKCYNEIAWEAKNASQAISRKKSEWVSNIFLGRENRRKSLMKKESFKHGITDGIPIALGYLAVSFTFGMMAVQNGLTIWQAVLISLTNLTSAGQFAGLDIIIAGGSLWEMALTQLIINLRYCLMSFSLSQKLRRDEPWGHRYAVAFGVTDEIFGVSVGKPGKVSAFYNYGVMSVAIPGWTIGTLLGAISGSILPAFIMSALGVAIYGMFLALIIPPSKKNKAVLMVVLSAMAMSALFAWVPALSGISSGFVIIIITVLVAGLAAWLCPISPAVEENKKENAYEA